MSKIHYPLYIDDKHIFNAGYVKSVCGSMIHILGISPARDEATYKKCKSKLRKAITKNPPDD